MAHAMEAFPARIHWVSGSFDTQDAVIYLQAFVVSVQGRTANLGHMWVREKRLMREDGAPLAGVGFGLGNEAVPDSMSADFAAYLKGLGLWLEYLERFRHALENLVPLYVPASDVSDDTLREFARLCERIRDTELGGAAEDADRLTRERSALVSISPVIEHVLGENVDKGVFHFQMRTYFHIVAEFAGRLLGEFR